MKKRISRKVVIILIVVIILLPLPIPISPKVSVVIVDKFGRPVTENAVRQDWEYRTIWTTRQNSEVSLTDRNGHIYFTRRYYWNSIGGEVLDLAENIFSMGHAGLGSKATLVIYGSEPAFWPCGKSDSLPDKIKLVETAQTN